MPDHAVTDQLEYTETELLENHAFTEPLIAGGVRCHGGFDDEGRYISPRTKHRVPAINAWQTAHARQFGTPLLDLPLETWPEHYPNVAQARYLLEEGVTQPLVSTLSRIGTVEGFGAYIRHSEIPALHEVFDDDVRGTAMDHLGRGLYEAHARDEAGFEDEGGHKQMWFAARDVAFENPVTEDETELMLRRMGISTTPGAAPPPRPPRVLPDDIDYSLEMLLERMAGLLLIEISAFHTFAWAESLLADPDLVAGDGEGARLVSYVRADETPHVEYLKTVLSEMRDRTVVGESGRKYAGTDVVGPIWDRALANSLGPRRDLGRQQTINELEHTLAGHPRRADILHRFHELGPQEARP